MLACVLEFAQWLFRSVLPRLRRTLSWVQEDQGFHVEVEFTLHMDFSYQHGSLTALVAIYLSDILTFRNSFFAISDDLLFFHRWITLKYWCTTFLLHYRTLNITDSISWWLRQGFTRCRNHYPFLDQGISTSRQTIHIFDQRTPLPGDISIPVLLGRPALWKVHWNQDTHIPSMHLSRTVLSRYWKSYVCGPFNTFINSTLSSDVLLSPTTHETRHSVSAFALWRPFWRPHREGQW